ncbi:PSP1 C-terminal conserved region family protein [Leishmania donovani]|uniref:PSP1 C-terminal conserved region family protein n=1 Tax=Leishmania donovani TaxID=5661 RepID=A0A504XMN9_LEIDO|nr:PSP1 C-terminal conserved region family protein [Leishmania donovani]
MPKSANTRGGAGSGSTYNTQRHEGGRPSARRATAPRAEATPKGTAAVEEKGKPTTVHQKVHISDPRSSAQRQRSEEDAQVQREPSSLSSMHALNASSPAFIPYQYVQQQQCGNAGDDVADAATQSVFSFTATPSLMYMGNTGGSSSVSSPLAFAVPSDAGHSTAMLSPFSPSLAAKQDSLANSATFASVASAAASGSALSTQPSHQLRGAYARATAAAAAAAASSALHLHHTDPYASVAAAPNSAVPAGTADAPPHTQLEPQQRCATRKTPVAASSTAKAVYGPSVPVFHSQFIDIATGNTSMTPFALLQEQPDGDDVDRLSEACDDRHTGAETAPEPATIGAMAAVPRSPPTLAQDREEAETQRVRQAYNSASQQPSQRRISAATAAVLASQDARLAERSRRYAQAGQLLYEPASATTTAALSSNGASSQRPSNKDASDAATAKPIVKAQRHTSAFETATASETETTTHETPKRRSPTVSTATVGTSNGNKVRTSVTPSIDGGASAVKRLHTCLASTDERTEGDRAGSAMGLTGSTRRGLPTCGDDNDDEGRRSDTVTPTTTPAKVLAAESSPFVAAAAASGGASTGRAHRRSVSREDSAVAHSECGLSESTRHTRLIAQIQTSNTTKGHAFSPAAATTAITPHKSSIQNAALGETGATAATPAAFKTPEVERVPSARPSASKNAAIRNITTIIHTPNTSSAHHGHSSAVTKTTITSETSRHHHSAAETSASAKDSRGAAPKVAQRSLASCLEAISPQRGESARNSSNAVRAELATAMSQAPLPSSSSAPFMPSGTAGAMPATNYAVVIEGHMQRRVTAVSSTVLKRGVCVLFEEDRGIDMGRVVQCDVLDGDGAASMLATMASATSPLSRKDRPAPVLRPATAEEEYRWLYADVKEAEATLEPCREAAARLGLPVKVVAAVYQFNKAKLTFYYESPTRVDFRPLLPSLFSRFHCRIWMARLETPEMTAAASGGVEEGAHTHLQAEKSA